MLISRRIGSMLRGNATPRQVLLATVLGGLLGFVPGFFLPGDLGGGFAQAPGLILSLLCLALVLNANLGVFGLTTLVAKLLSLLLLPASFAVGRFLLEGPMAGAFAWLINAPFTAWFGLEHYATSGGLVLGLLFGGVGGMLLNRLIRQVRVRMAGVEERSERYQNFSKKGWVKLLTWLLLGSGKGKRTWAELATSTKKGSPVRILGVLVVVVLGASLWVFQQWFSTPILTSNLQSGLAAINGATVDVGRAQLALDAGELRIENLAIADQKALGQDLFAAEALVARIDTTELLRRRFVIDELRASNARSGAPRSTPGVKLPKAEPPPLPPAPAGTKTIEDYLADFEYYKQRFDQVRQWLEEFAGEDAGSAGTPPTPQEVEQDRERQLAEVGLAHVVASHLLEGAPRVLIRRIDIEGIAISIDGKQDLLDLRGRMLSTAPGLVAETMSLGLTAQSDAMQFTFTGSSVAQPGIGFQFGLKSLAVDQVFGKLKIAGAAPLRGGTIDLSAAGRFTRAEGGLAVDLPVQARLVDTVFALAGAKETKVEELLLPIGLRGPLRRPSVSLDDQALQDALLKAGKQELANFVKGKAGKLLGGLPPELDAVLDPNKSAAELQQAAEEAAAKAAADAKAKLEAELQKQADAAKAKADEAKAKAEAELQKKAEEAAKKVLPGGLKGLLPGTKPKGEGGG